MPTYFAGWVNANATIRFGTGFAVARLGLTGSYRITIPPTPTGRFLVTTVSAAGPVAALGPLTSARVAQFMRNAADGSSIIDVEIRDETGALVDGAFNFVAIDRS